MHVQGVDSFYDCITLWWILHVSSSVVGNLELPQ
jgi:hypothetical protein